MTQEHAWLSTHNVPINTGLGSARGCHFCIRASLCYYQHMARSDEEYTLIGWREWIVFPDFDNVRVKAKIDTGARTSAIHAENVELVDRTDGQHVSFVVHPNQKDIENAVQCVAPLIDQRAITDSGGHVEQRFVVSANVQLAGQTWQVELSLTDRDAMGFRMLLGRTAMQKRFWVRPDKSFLHGR